MFNKVLNVYLVFLSIVKLNSGDLSVINDEKL